MHIISRFLHLALLRYPQSQYGKNKKLERLHSKSQHLTRNRQEEIKLDTVMENINILCNFFHFLLTKLLTLKQRPNSTVKFCDYW